jgi:hypothetical protein
MPTKPLAPYAAQLANNVKLKTPQLARLHRNHAN